MFPTKPLTKRQPGKFLLTNSDEDLNRKLRTKDIEIFVLGDGDGVPNAALTPSFFSMRRVYQSLSYPVTYMVQVCIPIWPGLPASKKRKEKKNVDSIYHLGLADQKNTYTENNWTVPLSEKNYYWIM